MRTTSAMVLLLAFETGCFGSEGVARESRYVRSSGPVSRLAARLDDTSTWLLVQGRGGGDVEVRARLVASRVEHLEDARLTLEGEGDALEVLFRHRSADTDLEWTEIAAPFQCALELSTGSGNIRVEGMASSVLAKTGSGSIDVATSGDVDLRTGWGDVVASGGAGSIDTGAGMVVYIVDPRAAGTLRIRSGSGDVVVKLPGGLGVDLDARAGAGTVQVTAADLYLHQEGNLRTTLGSGHTLALLADAASGNVIISQR